MKRLSPREKRLVGAAGAAVAAFILIRFAVGPLLAYHSRLREEIPAMRRGLIAARRCAARFAALRNEVGAVQARLADRKKEFNPYTSLSEMARREGLSTEEIVMEKKPLDEKSPADYGADVKPRLKVLKTEEPSGRKAGVKVASVAELVGKLKNEAGVL